MRGEKTVGYVDGALGERFTSGYDDTWSSDVRDHARKLGVGSRLARILSAHVEMKVAMMMILRGRQHSELGTFLGATR